MFSVRLNYMVWKKFQPHFCPDAYLENVLAEVCSVWDGLISGIFKRTLVWSEVNSSEVFFKIFFLTDVVSAKSQ